MGLNRVLTAGATRRCSSASAVIIIMATGATGAGSTLAGFAAAAFFAAALAAWAACVDESIRVWVI